MHHHRSHLCPQLVVITYILDGAFYSTLFNTASSAAPQTALRRRGRWDRTPSCDFGIRSPHSISRLDLIHLHLKFFFCFNIQREQIGFVITVFFSIRQCTAAKYCMYTIGILKVFYLTKNVVLFLHLCFSLCILKYV